MYSTFNAAQAEMRLIPSVSEGFELRRTIDHCQNPAYQLIALGINIIRSVKCRGALGTH